MDKQKETFAGTLERFRYKYDLSAVFDDFLTMSICAVTRNPATGESWYEGLYMETFAKYAQDGLRWEFPKLYAALVAEMEERVGGNNDVLGEYYELHFAKKGSSQFFTPWHICEFMAKMTVGEAPEGSTPLRILEPSCGSGRMLLATGIHAGRHHHFHGVDIDHTCVKIAALNLFLNGFFHSEVMCADFLLPDNFRISYRISFVPLGIFRIEDKEKSRLWHMLKAQHAAKKTKPQVAGIQLPSKSPDQPPQKDGVQISLF